MPSLPSGYDSLEEIEGGSRHRRYHAVQSSSGRPVEIQVLQLGDRPREEYEGRLRHLLAHPHPHRIDVLSLETEGSELVVVTERPRGPRVRELLLERSLQWHVATRWMISALLSIESLHREGMGHGGLDRDHLILDERRNLRLLLPDPPEGEAPLPADDLRQAGGCLLRMLRRAEEVVVDRTVVATQARAAEEGPPPEELLRVAEAAQAGHYASISTLRAELESALGEDAASVTSGADRESSFVGQRIAGYEILSILGRGGMGVVYRARDPRLDRLLALKTVRTELLGPLGKDRFLAEAQACSRITHPNIITVYAAGEENGDPFMAMELIEGRTLRELLEDTEVGWERKLRWAVDMLDALERLHEEGIVHRDLKPDNVMVTEEGVLKLMDFGLARLSEETEKAMAGRPMGTAGYMSPEQVRGEEVDGRSDLFSVGICLHRMLMGEMPFRGENALEVMEAIQSDAPEPLDPTAFDAPASLVPCLERALAKSPDDRFATAGEFRAALLSILEERARARGRRRRGLLAILVLLLVGASAVVTRLAQEGPPRDRETAVQHNELGQEYDRQGLVTEARGEFRQSILADGSYAVPWNNLAQLELAAGATAEADSLLSHALELDPEYAAAHFNLALVREEQGRAEEAANHYREALRIDPRFAGAYNNLGALYLAADAPDSARAVLEAGLARSDSTELAWPYLLRNLGKVAAAQGRQEEAVRRWRQALRGLPDDPQLLELLESVGNEP